MATLRELRIKARQLGVPDPRSLDEDELRAAIKKAKNGNSNGTKNKKAAVKVIKKVKGKRGPGRPRKVEVDEDDEIVETPKKRGRPKGSGKKAKATKAEAPKRGRGRPKKNSDASDSRPARKSSNKKNGSNPVGRPVGSGSGTRVAVPERIKWGKSFDFRDGSTAQYILNQLRKSAEKYDDTDDVREHAFGKLVGKINKIDELTFNNRSAGKPHTGDKAEGMLRYRINRTIFDYAVGTGQHEGSGNGAVATPAKKKKGRPAKVAEVPKKRGRPKKVRDDEEDAPKKRGRPKGSGKKNKTAKNEDAPKRRGRPPKVQADAPRRGRPPGSKNKKKSRV